MSIDLLSITAHPMRRSTDRVIGPVRSRLTDRGVGAMQRGHVPLKRCKCCNRPVGRLPDYCAECTQEDETDCW
jgi:hypothetical protein